MHLPKSYFKSRDDAYNQLCECLPIENMKQEDWIVIATSTGGIPIAVKLAKTLGASFDFIFSNKIYTSKNEDCELAIVTETGEIIIHEELMRSFSLDLESIYEDANSKIDNEISNNKVKYRDNLDIIDLEDKNVLLVDEGLNTGLTMMACIKSVINKKAKSICVAVPLLPAVTVNDIETIADDLYFVKSPAHFVSIDFYYENLKTIDLESIVKLQNSIKK